MVVKTIHSIGSATSLGRGWSLTTPDEDIVISGGPLVPGWGSVIPGNGRGEYKRMCSSGKFGTGVGT